MLRCGHCDVISESYEDWLTHLVSDHHQAKLGVSEVFTDHNKDPDRNMRSLIMWRMDPNVNPLDVLYHFARCEPLAFITDAYIHMFPHVNERFYVIVFDQKKFVDRIIKLQESYGEQKVVTSMVFIEKKSGYSDWEEKIETSFFYRRHEMLRRILCDMSWDDQMNNFLKKVTLDQSGYGLREVVIDELETLIRENLEDATLHPFGSCMTWLADVNADLDLYVDAAGDGGRSEQTREAKMEVMGKIHVMLKDKYGKKNSFQIKHARVPIIKLNHPSGLKVDISFDNCLSVQNSKLIRLLIRFDHRVRPLLMFLRYWARFHNVVGSHSIKSYALILMAFVFLRKQKLMPSVHELQAVPGTKSYTVCNWNAGFCQSREVAMKEYSWLKSIKEQNGDGLGQDVMKLAHGFFAEYAALDFENQVICPLLGGYIPKESFESPYGCKLPSEMALLKANLYTGQCLAFATQKILSVQDPFALNVNVTASCANPETLTSFKAACATAAEALKQYVNSYDSCGTVSILELCCQLITSERKRKRVIEKVSPMDGHDIPVNTEADDNEIVEDELNLNDSGKVPPWQKPIQEALHQFSNKREHNNSPVRVRRISIYDSSLQKFSPSPFQNDVAIKSETDGTSDTPTKNVKSVVVVVKKEADQSKSMTSFDQKSIESTTTDNIAKPSLKANLHKNCAAGIDTFTDYDSFPEESGPVVTFVNRNMNDSEAEQNEQVVTYVHTDVQLPQQPPTDNYIDFSLPLASQQVNASSTSDAFNYGYENTVVHQPKTLTKTSKPIKANIYVPPYLRLKPIEESAEINTNTEAKSNVQDKKIGDSQSISGVTDGATQFPKFKICMNEDFTTIFEKAALPIVIAGSLESVSVKNKMRTFWAIHTTCFFSNEHLWATLSVVSPCCSSKKLPSSATASIFSELNKTLQYEAKTEIPENEVASPRKKMMRTSSEADVSTGRFCQRIQFKSAAEHVDNSKFDALFCKLHNMPENPCKRFIMACYCQCNPVVMESLQSQWTKISSQRKAYSMGPSQNPLDAFVKLCTQVRQAFPVEFSANLVKVMLTLAFDTQGTIPAVYIGFQNVLPHDDPHFEGQQLAQNSIESLIKDLHQSYMTHCAHKYFK